MCEGESDQALIGVYIENTTGWEFCSNRQSGFPNESIVWYRNNLDELLGIWQVGGHDFCISLQTIMEREQLEATVDKIVVVTDHDDEEAERDRFKKIVDQLDDTMLLNSQIDDVKPNEWVWYEIRDPFKKKEIGFYYLLVPMEKTGALETFMLDALYEQDPEKESVINQVREFIRDFKSQVYLKQRRDRTKAELGVSMSVFSPDRIFTTMMELIKSVN